MDEKSYQNKTPREIKLLIESHELIKTLVLEWKREVEEKLDKIADKAEYRWDGHDKKSDERWGGIRTELERINTRISALPCEYRKGVTEAIQRDILTLKSCFWGFVVIAVGAPILIFFIKNLLHL